MTTLPAVVRVVDLPVATTITGSELFEVVQTASGVGLSVQVSLTNAIASIGSLPGGGTVGQVLTKSSATNYAASWTSTISTSLGVIGTTLVTGSFGVVGTTLMTGLFGVVGTSQFTGSFNVVGTATFSGVFGVIDGTTTFTSAVNVIGTTFITGSLSQVGTALFTSNLFSVVGTALVTGSFFAVPGGTIGTTSTYANASTNLYVAGTRENRIQRTGISGGAPATTGTTDVNQFLTVGNESVAWRLGFYTSGALWTQACLIGNYASNVGMYLSPNGGGVAIGAVSSAAVLAALNVVGTSLMTGALIVSDKITAFNATAVPSVGTAILLASSTAGFGIFIGTGVPSVSAATGSIYLRSDGVSATTRMYVNNSGTGTWTGVTTVA